MEIGQSMGRTFLITWNPRKFRWSELPAALEELAANGTFEMGWSVGNRTDLPVGSRMYLMRLGEEPKGLVGSGWSMTLPMTMSHWSEEQAALGRTAQSVTVEFDSLSEDPVLPLSELLDGDLRPFRSWTPQAGGVEIPPSIARVLDASWQRKLNGGLSQPSTSTASIALYPEGAMRSTWVNSYERHPQARRACIKHHGTSCAVCDFSFEEAYGPEFSGLIHVHHLRPLSELGQSYQIDPIVDLVPLCPNCHAAIHWKQLASTVEELREKLRAARSRGPQSPRSQLAKRTQ